MRTKKPLKESVKFKGVLDFDLPYVFCVRCDTERQAHEIKGFIDYWLKIQENKIRYEYYRISPFDDIVYLYHKSDEYDLPNEVAFYRPDTIISDKYITIKKDHIIHREEKDFKKLYEK